MANPNIINISNLKGLNAGLALTTSNQDLITNASNSGKILRVHSIVVANTDGVTAASVTCELGIGSNFFKIAHTVTVPPDATLILIGRDSPLYVMENGSIRALASASGDLDMICSYDEIS
tara:strand:+ start:15194 stop:15553 length:360 start_codon:yes stop_codon:yes gene_type:complete